MTQDAPPEASEHVHEKAAGSFSGVPVHVQKILPNYLTIFRIIIIPILVASFYVDGATGQWIAAGLFVIASATDYFDGVLARAWAVQSKLGTFLDPIADKLLVATVLIMLIHFERLGDLGVFAALIILCREIFVSGLREFLGQLNVSVPVSNLAKLKTSVQLFALFLLLLGAENIGGQYVNYVGQFFLWVAAVLTLMTGYAYLKAGMRYMD